MSKTFMLILLLMIVNVSAVSYIYTDKDDYHPGEIVTITGYGFVPFSLMNIDIVRPDGEIQVWEADSLQGSLIVKPNSIIDLYYLEDLTGLNFF